MVTSSPRYIMRGSPEPSRYAKNFILLAIRKQIFSRTHLHGIINLEPVIRTVKPKWKAGVRRYTQHWSFCQQIPVLIYWELIPSQVPCWKEQIRQARILPLWSSHSSGLMNNPEAANQRLVRCRWPPLVFCFAHTGLIFSFYNKLPTVASLKQATSGFLDNK